MLLWTLVWRVMIHSCKTQTITKDDRRTWAFTTCGRAGNNSLESIWRANRFESICYGKSKTNGVWFGRGHVVRSFTHEHTAQHTTFQIMKENLQRCLMKCFFLLSYLRHCAFTVNPTEITVNNFPSTFDNADHSSQMASAAEWSKNSESNQIEILPNRIESNLLSAESPSSNAQTAGGCYTAGFMDSWKKRWLGIVFLNTWKQKCHILDT